MGDLGKLIVAKGFKKLSKVQSIAQSGHTDPHPSQYAKIWLRHRRQVFHYCYQRLGSVIATVLGSRGKTWQGRIRISTSQTRFGSPCGSRIGGNLENESGANSSSSCDDISYHFRIPDHHHHRRFCSSLSSSAIASARRGRRETNPLRLSCVAPRWPRCRWSETRDLEAQPGWRGTGRHASASSCRQTSGEVSERNFAWPLYSMGLAWTSLNMYLPSTR